jgi:type II secretory pathway component GspD/PulD (secretin)
MEALTNATNTFVFPTADKVLYFAPDTQAKRDEVEPTVLLTFPLPEALDQKDLIEAATAVRGVLNMRAIGWDSANRMVLVRDRATRAYVARSLLEAVLLPKAQVSFEVQFITVDSDVSYHYGVSLPTVFQLINFGHIAHFQSVLPSGLSGNFLAFGGGATLFGVGLTDATLFASYSKSFSRVLFDATVVVGDRQTASLHIGDQYPIQTTVYSGARQSAGSIYNPVGQVTMEDLGLVLKLTPRINGEGEVSLDLEANYKALGAQVYDTIPAIAEREFKGTITMREDQWAVIAGLQENTQSITKSGFLGLGQIPGLDQILSQHTRETKTENLLLVIKPTLKTLPMSASISPQYLLGPERGERVLM